MDSMDPAGRVLSGITDQDGFSVDSNESLALWRRPKLTAWRMLYEGGWQFCVAIRIWPASLIRLRGLNHPRDIAVAFGALAHQQQIAAFDDAAEVGDRCFVAAMPAPNVGQHSLADGDGDRLPTLAGGFCESGQ